MTLRRKSNLITSTRIGVRVAMGTKATGTFEKVIKTFLVF